MVNIHLLPDASKVVGVSIKPTVITRVGDVMLLQNDTKIEFRPPWKELFVADHVSYLYENNENIIRFKTSIYNDSIKRCSEVDAQTISISIIQYCVKPYENNAQSIILSNCLIKRAYTSGTTLDVNFTFDYCDMIYNR